MEKSFTKESKSYHSESGYTKMHCHHTASRVTWRTIEQPTKL